MKSYLSNITLKFLDKEVEQKFRESNLEFQVKGFKIILFIMGLLSCYTIIFNPYSKLALKWTILVPMFQVSALVIYYFIITRKFRSYIEQALIFLTSFIIIYPTETPTKKDWHYVSLFFYYCTMQLLISTLILVRIAWTKNIFAIAALEVYFCFRNVNLGDSINNDLYAVIATCVNVIALWGFSYFCEKNTRIDFYEKYMSTKSMEIFKDIINNIIPQSALVVKNSKLIFHNKATTNLFESQEEAGILELLKTVVIHQQDGMESIINNDFRLMNPDQMSDILLDNSGTLWSVVQNMKPGGNLNEFSYYCGYKDRSLNDGSIKPLDIQIGKILWEKEESTLLLINDVSAAKRLKYLKELGDYKDKLLATVSHDLRTPLNGIMGMMRLVKERVTADEISQNFLKISFNSANLLLYMINDILDFSQISNGKVRLNRKQCDVHGLVMEVYELVFMQALNKNVSLEVVNNIQPPELRFACTDGNRVKQVLLNLMSNALKFTSQGFIKVKLKSDGEKIKISVSDSGRGIMEEDIPKLFRLFGKLEQIGRESGINESGVGLGLAVSQNLVRLLNNNKGEISVKSEYNVGSKFSFPIFYATGYDNGSLFEERQSPAFPRVSTHQNQLGPLNKLKDHCRLFHILIVDDDQINIFVGINYLKSLGKYNFKTANNGKEAVELIQKISQMGQPMFDVILMDCNMPIMDGYQASKEIKSLVQRGEIEPLKIVAVTANVSEADKQKCKESGMDHFLSKPIEKNELQKLLEKFCREK